MFKKCISVLSLSLFFISLYLSIPASVAKAYYTNMPASVVIGQPDFISGTANQGSTANSNTLNQAKNVYFDPNSKKLFIADSTNNRVLIYNSIPTTNNASADIVIGQADFTHGSANQGGTVGANTLSNPRGMLVVAGHLLLIDAGNHRSLIYNSIPTTNNASADIVIGQADFTHGSANQGGSVSANTLNTPASLAFDGQELFISDQGNNRVLIYNSMPISNNVLANVVLGQSAFNTNVSNQGGIGANTLSTPIGLLIVDHKLLVGDVTNNRVLIWNSIPITNKAPADVVMGQTNFISNGDPGVASGSQVRPQDLVYDGKRLIISHDFNAIVSFHNGIPTTNGALLDLVIGEYNVNSIDASHFHEPRGLAVAEDELMVADLDNSRILIFPNTIDTPSMNITTPPEKVNNTTLRVKGSIQLGNRPNYSMQWVKTEINGGGLGYVTSLGGGRDNGDSLTLYDFMNEFNPTVNGGTTTNYTMKLVASSFNADTTSLFYFEPFNFDYIRRTNPTLTLSKQSLNISFLVNKQNIQRMKDNIDHFEVLTSTNSGRLWKPLTTNISTDKIDTTTGQIYLTISNTLLPKVKYLIKVVAVSKDSNWRQDSNILIYFVPLKKSSR